MADQPTTPSGSRWEPDPDQTPASEAPPTPPLATDAPIPAGDPFGTPVSGPVTTESEDPAAAERRARLRSRAILAGAATALALGGGLTGFVIGHSTAGDSTPGFRPANFQGPGQQFGEGQQGPPSFGDRDGDGDHGFGQPQDFGNGSPGSGTSGSGTSGSGTSGT
jgi:hypothetical protein